MARRKKIGNKIYSNTYSKNTASQRKFYRTQYANVRAVRGDDGRSRIFVRGKL